MLLPGRCSAFFRQLQPAFSVDKSRITYGRKNVQGAKFTINFYFLCFFRHNVKNAAESAFLLDFSMGLRIEYTG